jgi:hypothetical protein
MKIPEIITLCGSTKFKDDFIQVQKELSLNNKIVISVGLFGHVDMPEIFNNGIKEMFDELHKRKIDISNSIYVINKNGYIGESTRNEILYAIVNNKNIYFMENNNKTNNFKKFVKNLKIKSGLQFKYNNDIIEEMIKKDLVISLTYTVNEIYKRIDRMGYILTHNDIEDTIYTFTYVKRDGYSYSYNVKENDWIIKTESDDIIIYKDNDLIKILN